MRYPILMIAMIALFSLGCSDDDSTTSPKADPVYGEFTTLSHWWATTPDVDLSEYDTAELRATFANAGANDIEFDLAVGFQLWSDPDVYNFVVEDAVTIVAQPSGAVPPGGSIYFSLLVDLANIPADQVHIAIRPTNTTNGTLGPGQLTLLSSEVTWIP